MHLFLNMHASGHTSFCFQEKRGSLGHWDFFWTSSGAPLFGHCSLVGFMGGLHNKQFFHKRCGHTFVWLWKRAPDPAADHNVYIVCSEVRDTSGRSMFFTRLSAQVYLDLNDFRTLAELVLELVGAPSLSAHPQKYVPLGLWLNSQPLWCVGLLRFCFP